MGRGQSGAGGLGKGVPIAFVCPVARRERESWTAVFNPGALPAGHERIVRTGQTRPHRPKGARSARMLAVAHEYRCECGHVGWTAHTNILRYPLEAE